jgi:hypothetical protein
MKTHALSVFRKSPERLNCAQAVLHAWQAVTGDTRIALAELKPFGGGRAPEGICGALYGACVAAPHRAAALRSGFAARLGSVHCKTLRTGGDHACQECVAYAAELLASQT